MTESRGLAMFHRFLRRLVVAFPLALFTVYAIDHWALPAYVWQGYQAHTKVNVLEQPPVDEGAGSHDIHYMAASFDCTAGDLWVVGPEPDADYWMIGIYDLRMRQIPNGHLNHRSVEIDPDGRFRIHVTRTPTGGRNELDCSTSVHGMLVVRILRPHSEVIDPWIEDHS